MLKLDWSPDLELPESPRVVALGAFDGVHLGHAKTIREMRRLARERDAQATVLTFDPGPREFRDGKRLAGRRLTPLDEQLYYLRKLGVELVVVFKFPGEIHRVEPEDFVRRVLVGQLGAIHVTAGPTHRFGRAGAGDVALLQKLGDELGFGVDILFPVMIDGVRVSSTRIRELLDDGRVHEAGALLGRPYAINASVVSGRGLGAEIGFPTANLSVSPEKILPRDGVYAALCAKVHGKDYEVLQQMRAAAVNVGLAPTVRGDERIVEVHVIGEQCDLSGSILKVEFLRWLRGEKEFEHLKALSEQISADTERAATLAKVKLGDSLQEFDRMCTTDHVIRRDGQL